MRKNLLFIICSVILIAVLDYIANYDPYGIYHLIFPV